MAKLPTKLRIWRPIEKYLANPLNRVALRLGVAPRAFALLETTGRRTGRTRRTPVGNGLEGDTFWLVAEHGERCHYVHNLLANPNVQVKVGRRRRSGVASPVRGDDAWARRHAIDRANGLGGRIDGVIFRASATDPLTIRIDLEPDVGP